MRIFLAAAVLAALAPLAHASPRPLPFTYTTDTNPEGNAELEIYADITPLRAISPLTSNAETYNASSFQMEFEYGLTDRLELGMYLTYTPNFGDSLANQARFAGGGTGTKQRLRYALATPGEWPVDVGVYAELVENEREIEIEGKLILNRNFDRLRLAANLWVEHEWYFSGQREVVIHPTAGAVYEITPTYQVGIEGWVRGEYPYSPKPPMRTFGLGPQAYLGPTVLLNFGKIRWTLGLYARVTDTSHDLTIGEPYGKVWGRSLVGFDL